MSKRVLTAILTCSTPCVCCALEQAAPAYSKLRVERMNVRMAGIRAKRAKEAEAAEKDN
jgi:hypothetical protein